MLLKRGDSGPAVKGLQRDLNKLGSLLLVDGDFGAATVEAVGDACVFLGKPPSQQADDAFQAALAAVPDPFPPLTAPGVTFIARTEVSGPREYRRKFKNPCWPSAESGITIGIGYDLKFCDAAKFKADWGDVLPASAATSLAPTFRKTGSDALLAGVQTVDVPLLAAVKVFIRRTLPGCLEETLKIYPQADKLPPARLTALVSLIYNRGNRLTDNDPVRQERREMRRIKQLLASGNLDQVDEQFESMTRLWDPAKLAGLIKRRLDEAKLWRSGFESFQLA